MNNSQKNISTAIFAGGCFWCTQAIFSRLKGVEETTVGYALGDDGLEEPAEVVKIEFDPEVISFDQLLEVFWKLHDPTSLNKQMNDVGPGYRSAIFATNEEQFKKAQDSMKKAQKDYKKEIITSISNLNSFEEAHESHQEYYEKNKNVPYCKIIIDPKIQKLEKGFSEMLETKS